MHSFHDALVSFAERRDITMKELVNKILNGREKIEDVYFVAIKLTVTGHPAKSSRLWKR